MCAEVIIFSMDWHVNPPACVTELQAYHGLLGRLQYTDFTEGSFYGANLFSISFFAIPHPSLLPVI